jgi:hypothetical protein
MRYCKQHQLHKATRVKKRGIDTAGIDRWQLLVFNVPIMPVRAIRNHR